MQRFTSLIGRVLLAAIFLISGVRKVINFTGTQQYMAAHGLPLTAFLLVGAIILELGGGLSVLLGYRTKWGAWALIIFLLPTTLIFHGNLSDQVQQIMFLKNAAILGGLLLLLGQGPGPLSIDASVRRPPET